MVAKFCANCGKPLGDGAAAGDAAQFLSAEHRKVITAVFFDLVGSTGLTERLDPEEAREVIGRFYAAVQRTVERFNGTVANLLGDGVLAVFGLPVTYENDPERAVRASLAMKDAMAQLNEDLAAAYAVRLNIRVGINTGEVVAASGSTFDRDFLVSDAVTTAARIQQTVPPGVIVVGERTYRQTQNVIEYRDLPPMEVKGKAAPLRVWEAVAPLPERQEARRTAAPLVGREFELGLLRQFYERTCTEALVHMVTVLGQPGVGKSRLLAEFLAGLQDNTPRPLVLRGRSIAFGGQIGYHALLDILRAQGGFLDTEPPDAVREKLGRWLQQVLPEHEGLLDGLMLTFGTADGADADPGRMRRALFDAWTRLLTGLAATRPLIVVFEDVHWADEGLLDLVQSVSGGLEGTSLFIICLGRPDLLERRPTWGAGGRNALIIDLKPLRPRETQLLVESLGRTSLAPETRQKIAERAGGNPLFAEELVRMLTEDPSIAPIAGGGMQIPDTVQAVLAARIDRLPPDERRALQAAAVIGRTFWPSAVAQLAGLAPDDAARAIGALVTKELAYPHRQSAIAGEPEYAFRQMLTRDVAYGMLPRAQRQRAHALAARWLEAQLGERVEESVQILAEHFRMAGDDARAAVYLHRAANKARQEYANADAIRFFDQALGAARKADLIDEIPKLHIGRGDVHELLAGYAAALADFEAVLAAARQRGDRVLEAALESRIGAIHHREARFAEAEAHFTSAIRLARDLGDRPTLGLALVHLATLAWDRGNNAAANQILSEGVAVLRDLGDQASLARASNLRCMVNLAMGHGADAIAAAEEALAAARAVGDKSREATSLSYLGVVHGWTGRPRIGLDYDRAALEIAEKIGDRRRSTYAKEFMAQAFMELGEWGEGIRLTEELLPDAHEVTRQELPFLYLFLGLMYAEAGDANRAREAFRVAPTFEIPNLAWRKIAEVARIFLARLEQDADTLNRALDDILGLPWETFVPIDGMVLLPVGEGLLEAGRIDELRALVRERRASIERFESPPYLATFAMLEAHLAVRDGDRETAAAHLEKTVQWSTASENALMLRRTLELRLRLFNRPEDREALRSLLTRISRGLPDDLREIFLTSPRVAPYLPA